MKEHFIVAAVVASVLSQTVSTMSFQCPPSCPPHYGPCAGKVKWIIQKQQPRGVLRKRCSENTQQTCRRTPISKCDFNKVDLQLY